jgi:RNA polymerase sigma-70 factor (ECF subfamily)
MNPELQDATFESLFVRYQQADADATTELVRRLTPDLLRFFLAQEATRAEAEDLLQNTWLRIHKARHTYRPGARVLPWVFAIAKHVRVDGYRQRRRITRFEVTAEQLPDVKPDAQPLAATLTFESLIAALPESQREVLTLLKVNGLSLEEIARATSSTVGAVKQKASRAYAKLRESLLASGTWPEQGRERSKAG